MTPPRKASIDGLLVQEAILAMGFKEGRVTIELDEVPIAIVETKATLDRFVIVVEWL